MRWSHYFIPTLKEIPAGTEAVSHQLLLRAGLINMVTAGVYSYLPLGWRILNRIQDIIRDEMNAAGAHELLLSCLQPLDIWKRTGRDETLKDVMIRFQDQRKRELCLGPTHEEIITELVGHYVQSYRQLPVTLYQIQTKFRDELRPRFGIVRACEFIMKDAYSFDKDVPSMQASYQRMYAAYEKVFKKMDLDVVIITAESGAMGGDVSHEFLVPAPIGEDMVFICPQCGYAQGPGGVPDNEPRCPRCSRTKLQRQAAIELGHVFQLGTKYSQSLGAFYVDENGQQKPFIMGCYGIGVSRLIAALIECHHDQQGIIWPAKVAPFEVEILPLQVQEQVVMQTAEELYTALSRSGIEVLMDDRDESAGRKFNDADLIGIPWRVTIGTKGLRQGNLEIKQRKDDQHQAVPVKEALATLMALVRPDRNH